MLVRLWVCYECLIDTGLSIHTKPHTNAHRSSFMQVMQVMVTRDRLWVASRVWMWLVFVVNVFSLSLSHTHTRSLTILLNFASVCLAKKYAQSDSAAQLLRFKDRLHADQALLREPHSTSKVRRGRTTANHFQTQPRAPPRVVYILVDVTFSLSRCLM